VEVWRVYWSHIVVGIQQKSGGKSYEKITTQVNILGGRGPTGEVAAKAVRFDAMLFL
jgi:hypothetical protein